MLATLATLLVLALVWGVGIEPRLIIVTESEEARVPDLPAHWEGKRLAFITDLHVGMWLDNPGTIRDIVERIVRERPAAVLLGGDYVYVTGHAALGQVLPELQTLLRPLTEAGIPVFAVLGNHDYAQLLPQHPPDNTVASNVVRALEEIGVRVLRNEAAPLRAESAEPVYIVGIGARWPDHAHPQAALADVPEGAPRVVLMHNPDTFAELPPDSAPLALAGHTHGGQVRIPFLPEWSWLTLAWSGDVHADGWIRDFGARGNSLFVSQGIGFSRYPIRINCPPELTYFSLRAAGDDARATAGRPPRR